MGSFRYSHLMLNRNVLVLALAQALGMSGVTLALLVAGIVGARLAPNPSWATLPNALLIVGGAISAVPAALIMQRIGRRAGFCLAAGVACMGAFSTAYFIHSQSFVPFCLSMLLLGLNMAFIQQYRFAAIESVAPNQAGQAVSRVLLGGIGAGLLGPEIGKLAKDWFGFQEYAGSFIVLGGVYAVVVLILLLYTQAPATASQSDEQKPSRSLGDIIGQPVFITAFLSATVAYGSMTLLMTATPLSMHVMDHFSLEDTARVIQGHILGMFVPSFFTGNLIRRFGVYRILLAGITVLIACSLIGIWDRSFLHYWTALVLLGVGWNFLFIGGTTLLAHSYRPAESFKVQAFNDFGVFSLQFIAASSAGFLIFNTSWIMLNLLVTPFFALLLIRYLWVQRHSLISPLADST